MDIFDFVTVAVSFVLGLAVAFMLESTVKVFHARKSSRLDWLPFVWVGCVLVQLFQFWWAIYAIHTMASVSIGVFTMLLVLSGLLFLAGALVLPSRELEYPDDLADYFATDASWGVASLAVYNAAAVLTNVVLFADGPVRPGNLLNWAMFVVAAIIVPVRGRTALVVLSLGYVALLIVATIVNTPASY